MTLPFQAMQIPTAALLNRAIVDVDAMPITPITLSTTSGSNVDVTGFVFNFTKQQAATRLVVVPIWTNWSTAVSTGVTFAVRVDSNDFDAGYFFHNIASDHKALIGVTVINGLSAGAKTLQVRARRTSGAGTLQCDVNDRGYMLVFEVP